MAKAFDDLTAVYGDIEIHVWHSAAGSYVVMVEDTRTATVVQSKHYGDPGDAIQAYVAECYWFGER